VFEHRLGCEEGERMVRGEIAQGVVWATAKPASGALQFAACRIEGGVLLGMCVVALAFPVQ
jgi:hypothetical protein